MKTISKILLILVISMTAMLIVPQTEVLAETVEIIDGVTIDTSSATDPHAAGQMKDVVERVLGFLQVASALLAVVMIAATGFRYIIETPDMKNELKKSMIPIIVGILLVFFAVSIAKFFVGMFEN